MSPSTLPWAIAWSGTAAENARTKAVKAARVARWTSSVVIADFQIEGTLGIGMKSPIGAVAEVVDPGARLPVLVEAVLHAHVDHEEAAHAGIGKAIGIGVVEGAVLAPAVAHAAG